MRSGSIVRPSISAFRVDDPGPNPGRSTTNLSFNALGNLLYFVFLSLFLKYPPSLLVYFFTESSLIICLCSLKTCLASNLPSSLSALSLQGGLSYNDFNQSLDSLQSSLSKGYYSKAFVLCLETPALCYGFSSCIFLVFVWLFLLFFCFIFEGVNFDGVFF